jgi:predicted nucleotidyltransferase
MIDEFTILEDITRRLDALRLPFMLTGSLAMNYYAVPRMTRDIDLVLMMPPGRVRSFVEALGQDYMIVEEAVDSAVAHQSMFNAIHMESTVKVDFVCLKDQEFRHEEFSRRKRVKIDGFETWIVSREDLILSKLVWSKDSNSETQHADIRNLLKKDCDDAYLDKWATRLGVAGKLAELRAR